MFKTARSKRVFKIIRTIFFILAICMFVLSGKNMVTYSRYIDEPVSALLSLSDKANTFWFYNMLESDDQGFALHTGIMNGKNRLGDLTVKNDSVITDHVEKRFGRARLLFVNASTGKEALYQDVSDRMPVSLPQGTYHTYLVSSWFSGLCGLNYSNAAFAIADK